MVDLHIHTTFSDGSFTPEEIIDKSLELNLKYIAITDHDTIDGLERAINYSKDKAITLIPGIEISINYRKGIFHLLGLGIDYKNIDIINFCKKVMENRNQRNIELIKNLNSNGYKITLDEIKNNTESSVIGRPHIADTLIKKGYSKSYKEVFNNIIGVGSPSYVGMKNSDIEEAIDIIHKAKGLAIIAHPLSLNLSWENFEKFLIEKKSQGLDGVEVFHPSYSMIRCNRVNTIADKLDLIKTSGSDFHGVSKPKISIGKRSNKSKIPIEFLPKFLKDKYS